MCPLISFGLHIFIHEYGSAATAATYFHARVHYTIHIYIYMSSPARRQNAHSLHERNAHTQAQCAHIVDTARCVWVCMCIFFFTSSPPSSSIDFHQCKCATFRQSVFCRHSNCSHAFRTVQRYGVRYIDYIDIKQEKKYVFNIEKKCISSAVLGEFMFENSSAKKKIKREFSLKNTSFSLG